MAHATKALTDATVKAFRTREGQIQADLWDGLIKGLHLRASAGGTKTWQLRYRIDNRNPRFALGRYPALGLKDAREAAQEILRQVAKGTDPASARRQARAAPADAISTFNDLADRYEKACAEGDWQPKGKQKRESVLIEEKRILAKNVRPTLGRLPFGAITRAEIKALLKRLREPTKERAHKLGAQTNRTHAVIRQVFAFAISDELLEVNPATGFAPLAQESPRDRIWSDAELRALWVGLGNPAAVLDADGKPVPVGEGVCIALKLAMMLGQRRGEIIGMARAELDLPARTWLIPKERMKGSRAHMVPLSTEAVALIERAIVIADQDRDEPSAFVFPTTRAEDRPIRPDSMSQGLRRLSAGLKIEGAHVHDLRRTVSTNLTSERCSVSPFIRSKILGHIDGGGGAMVSSTHYDRNSYLAEKRDGLERWTALLLEIVGERVRPSNVSQLREAVA